MYNHHFGFREKPFQLVPNPAYLFLSKSHEEALAHLNYAVSQGDGFVEITGEVGTGKTTLCRAFIEGLDDGTETAYIFNPRMSADELLEAIHDEFGAPYQAGGSTKSLVDSLNAFLLGKKAEGKKALLVIDEAQNLSREVLEQVRLLSNLETSTEKLLQIVLVGQPELSDMLNTYELRQLGQRITLSACLTPLSYADTVRYIRHRLHIAARGAEVRFTKGAFRKIYRFSRGIPRMIHIVCDRSLLVTYVMEKEAVTAGIVKTAIGELSGRGNYRRNPFSVGRVSLAVAALIGAGVLGFFGFREPDGRFSNAPMVQNRQSPVSPAALPATAPPTVAPLAEKVFPFFNRGEAVAAVLSFWGQSAELTPEIDAVRNDPAFFRSAAEKNGFELYRVEGDLALLRTLNLPAVLTCYVAGMDALRYLILIGLNGESMQFYNGEKGAVVSLTTGEVAGRWSGVAFVPWKNVFGLNGTIPLSASEQSVLMLKGLLKEIGFSHIAPGAAYDDGTQEAIKEIQKKYGVEVDGLVGALTKILLYNEQGAFDAPRLVQKD